MDAKDMLTIVVGCGTLLIALLTLIVNIVMALISQKRK
ncbi:putative holin-like toxin [Paenibacillus chartarius]|uniref:Holin-like toxin n=1 Tax=Paenibacillus chartarius TaxID=747481 RepID=A0ABV6DPD1_9BACL